MSEIILSGTVPTNRGYRSYRVDNYEQTFFLHVWGPCTRPITSTMAGDKDLLVAIASGYPAPPDCEDAHGKQE